MATIEAAEIREPVETATGTVPSTLGELIPGHLSSVEQRQLAQLLEQYFEVFSCDDEELGQTPVLEHTIKTQGLPVRLPYCRQNQTVRQEEVKQVQLILESGVIHPSNSPWASPVVMVRKKDGRLCFCVDF